MSTEGWHPDPQGEHELRYHDGTDWTEHVSDGGQTSTDPLPSATGDTPESGKTGLAGKAFGAAKDAAAATAARNAERARQKAETKARAEAQAGAQRAAMVAAGDLWEYRVETIRETLIGDKIDHAALQSRLNANAAEGWRLKTITSATVTGRVGAGGTSGLIVTFERQVRA